MFNWWRKLRRAKVVAQAFPARYRALIVRRVPLARHLMEPDLAKLEALVRILMAEKSFEGAGGLELTEEMCVIIAARACLLVLHRTELDEPLYPDLDAIVVYPSTYRAPHRVQQGYVVIEGEQSRLGESWTRGVVVLAWDAVHAGGDNLRDGHDVVLHEFAHQLDGEGGAMDGTPELDSLERYAVWAKLAGKEYRALRDAVERHRPTIVDPYGATNAAEFFAVVVEQFVEKPDALRRLNPRLYRELVSFFRFDPAQLLATEPRVQSPPV